MESPIFYLLVFVHLGGLVLGFGSVLVTDLYGALWLFDRVRFPQLVKVSGVTGKFVWVGWGVMVAAGIPLILIKGVVDNLMVLKIFFVALLGVNGVGLHILHDRVRGYAEGEDVPLPTMFRLFLAIFVSQLGWWAAMIIGFLHRQVQSVIEWPPHPWLVVAGILAAIGAVWAIGEALARRAEPT